MREFASPLTFEIATSGNLTDDVVRNAQEVPDASVFSRRVGTGETSGWIDVTSAEFLDQVRAVAKGLMASGVAAGDRVAIFSQTRYEWTLVDYAIWFAGAISVPIYETSSPEQISWILQDSGATAAFAQGADHVSRIVQAARSAGLPVPSTWSMSEEGISQVSAAGSSLSDAALEARRTLATPQSVATLIYTSGTTGRPKGCVLTHGNFMFELDVAVHELDRLFSTEASTLLFLPLAHVLARIIQIGAVKARVRLGHSADIANLLEDLGEFKPTFILAVPRVFEKVFNSASQKATAEGRGRIFDRATAVAIAHSRASAAGKVGLVLAAQHRVFSKLVYARLLAALGGNCEFAVSGGAPLGERLGHFYRGIGLTVLEGYGLTETTAAVTLNLPDAIKVGTVGRPLPGTSVRVAEDGELQFRGGQIMAGYWNNDEATAQAFVDRWFRTGDLGELDAEGFVSITGRKKEILVTAGGKNVAPAVLEDRVRAHALVDQCMVVGDGRPFIAALITVDTDMLPVWAEQRGKRLHLPSLVDDPDLRAEIQEAIDEANRVVSKAESIRRFTIVPDAWTVESGHLTPSLKLKRNVVMREFTSTVDSLYL